MGAYKPFLVSLLLMDIEILNQILNHYRNKNKLGLRLLLLYKSAHTP